MAQTDASTRFQFSARCDAIFDLEGANASGVLKIKDRSGVRNFRPPSCTPFGTSPLGNPASGVGPSSATSGRCV
jgi:hypothetical protein